MIAWTPIDAGWRIEEEGCAVDISAGVAVDAAAPPIALMIGVASRTEIVRAIVDLEQREVRACLGSAELASRLVAEMPDAVRDELLAARGERIDLQGPHLSRARIESGKTVGTSPLYTGRGASIVDKGTGFLGVLTHGGRTWLTEQTICANPSCDCQEVYLHVEGVNRSGVSALMDLTTGAVRVRGVYDVSPEVGDALLAAWLEQQPDLRERSARDYADLRELASRSLKKSISRKPSKNAPCPCGSGRRYKSCCGASK